MSDYSLDPAADAAVQAQLAQQAASLSAPPAAAPDLSAATATAVDVEKLLGQLQELQARAQAAVDAANPPPPVPDTSLQMDAGAPGYLHAFKDTVEARLSAIEEKLGI